jgi:pyruvate dehydrogenase E2 component (dihydrolipoamide acetyltransferase)
MATRVDVPYLGLTTVEVTVAGWLKNPGDAVAKGEPLVEVLTDKVNNVIEAPEAGVVLAITAPVDTVVPVQGSLCWIGQPGEQVPDTMDALSLESSQEPPTSGPAEVSVGASVEVLEPEKTTTNGYVKASPAAKRVARELGIDLASVTGSGPEGRVVETDVSSHAAQHIQTESVRATPVAKKMAADHGVDLARLTGTGIGGRINADDVTRAAAQPAGGSTANQVAWPTRAGVPLTPAEVLSEVPMAGLRRIVAQRMFQSAHTIPRVTHTTEVDVTETVRMRQSLVARAEADGSIRPSYTDIIVKITARALREHPMMNARLAEETIQVLDAVNVGVAVAVPDGLVVPVIQDADRKNLKAITEESRQRVERARAGALVAEDITGGTFTVTNLGTYEIDAFTPIVNLPETGILGIGRIVQKPAVVDGQIAIRSMMYLSLTFDHRIIDGAPAAAFLLTIKRYLENPYELVSTC